MIIMDYAETLKKNLDHAYAVASKARQQGFDPSKEVEVKIAQDVAARVESIVGPPNIAKRIREMEKSGTSRENIAFELTKQIAKGEIFKGTDEQRVEQAIRTAVGLLTEGVLVAPTEGISDVKIKNNPDGSNYLAIYYAGPIRSAGATAMALSAMVGDVARKLAGVTDYRPTNTQIERYVEEVNMYEARASHLQYKPSDDDVRFIVQHCPISIDGTPTEAIEVSAYRNVPGVETNRIRGGVPLVLCEGIAQKAAKLLKYSKKYKMGWDWLEKIVKISKGKGPSIPSANETYLEGLVAGRPVFAYPSRKGAFRLRYGRARTNGLMAKCIHPAVMSLLGGFLAIGTHMKIERPGKGCVVTPHDDLEPPVVKLKDGSVRKIQSIEEADAVKDDIEKILFLGDLLITYGDFLKSNQPLLPPGFCEEWWLQEVKQKGVRPITFSSAKQAFDFSKQHNVPLHPDYTFPWHDISLDDLQTLVKGMGQGKARKEGKEIREFILEPGPWKKVLEELWVEHRLLKDKIILDGNTAYALLASLGFSENFEPSSLDISSQSTLQAVNSLSKLQILPKAPTYLGARMGRPEKAKERKMEGTPHVLFPTGSQKNRSLTRLYRQIKTQAGAKVGRVELVRFRCTQCNAIGFYGRCLQCNGIAKIERICSVCKQAVSVAEHCERPTVAFEARTVEVSELFQRLRESLGYNGEEIKGVKGLSNTERIPERLEKGYLRAKYDVYVFRDGTSRFDATNVPVSHFTPKEIRTTLEKLQELGYTKEYLGNPLTQEDQLLPLQYQDIIISEAAASYFLRVASYIDELLMNFYSLHPFYNCRTKEDLVGHMVISLSPHTSAAVLGRIIGFTKANVGYCHPYTIAARRRNCLHKKTIIGYMNDTHIHSQSIEKMFERYAQNKKIIKDVYKTELLDLKDLSVYAFGTNTYGNPEKKKIVQIMRRPHQGKLLSIIGQNKEEVSVTPDHRVWIYNEKTNQLKEKRAEQLDKNDALYSLGNSSSDHLKKIKIREIREIDYADYVYDLTLEKGKDKIFACTSHKILVHNCDGDEDSTMLLLDPLLNFSRHYLDEKRGGTMDAPLVLTPNIDPSEIDDEVHAIELVNSYPLEFYQAAQAYKMPSEVKLRIVKHILGTPNQFQPFPLTHIGGSLDNANLRTRYVQLQSVPEKLEVQFALQDRIHAVDKRNAAQRLMESHFIPDLYGNLRSYSRQTFRCVECNASYRRPPLVGKCIRCGGNLLLTIHKGGIEKYLEISKKIIKRYQLPEYTKQLIDLVEKEIQSIFEEEEEKQSNLAEFV